ncbi:MAG: hypothetical protein EOM87_04465 [Clostridia bacterium]|nr:hypothetical protein [Clostridia bacterium]
MNNYDRRYGPPREHAPRQERPRMRPSYGRPVRRKKNPALGVVKVLTIVLFSFFLLSAVGLLGGMGLTVKKYFMGLFGLSAIAIAVAGMLICALKIFGFRLSRMKGKTAFFTFTLVGIFLLFLQIITTVEIFRSIENITLSQYLKVCFDNGARISGGLIAGIFAYPFLNWVGARMSLILLTMMFFGIAFFTFLPLLLEEKQINREVTAAPRTQKIIKSKEEVSLFVDTVDGSKNANKINKKSIFTSKNEDSGFSILNPNKEQDFDREEREEAVFSSKQGINSEDPSVRKQAVKNILFHMDDKEASAIFSESKEREKPVEDKPKPVNTPPKMTEYKPKDDELPIFLGTRKLAQNKASELLYGEINKSQKSLLPDDAKGGRTITPEDASAMEYKRDDFYSKDRGDAPKQQAEDSAKPSKQTAKDILFGKGIQQQSSKPVGNGNDIRTDGNFGLFGVKKEKPKKDEKQSRSFDDALSKLDGQKTSRSLLNFDEDKPARKSGGILPDINDVLFRNDRKESNLDKKPLIRAEQMVLGEKPEPKKIDRRYTAPPYSLLKEYPPPKIVEDHNEVANNLCNALAAFDINAEVIGHQRGPTFTQFAFRMPDGVSIKRVTSIETDIKRKLKTTEDIRIIPAIEGMDAFGIEMPNLVRSTIGMKDLINSPKFDQENKLFFALGVDVTGTPYYCDLLSMPHLLIAGSTGSGKSVCLNTIICSFLYHYSPEIVRFIMIDPKKVELNVYNGIPHMILNSTVTECNKAVNALSWAISEMDRRYSVLQEASCRSIYDYNAKQKLEGKEKMPYIVIVIDEMADLMTRARKDVEDRINSLTSKARASGIHLITATQRPSVDVITGTIKNNLPTRIAFKVTSFADSKTILDKAGADKLFGKGDMLFMSAEFSEPKRLQGPFLSDQEVRDIVKYVKSNNSADYDEEASKIIFAEKVAADDAASNIEENSDGENDPLFEEAVRFVVESKIGSISMLQRRYHIGFNRAGRLIDAMSARGMVEQLEYGTSKPRSVLITSEDLERIFSSGEDDE